MSTYIAVPMFTTFNDIVNNGYTLSASQYKTFSIPNTNVYLLSHFLDRKLTRDDLGNEVGSDNYIDDSKYKFIKTRALQPESFLLDTTGEGMSFITPKNFNDMKLRKGDIIISKDSNVGEVIILDKDYPLTMLCGGLYKLPITKNKYYLLAMMKSDLFRQQIDFLVPKGSTIRHGKTKFLECEIPMPNQNAEQVVEYVESLMKAIINKEIEIKHKYQRILNLIKLELTNNQGPNPFTYEFPSINEIMSVGRLDSSLYSVQFKREMHLLENYKYGVSSIGELHFDISRGQNLQVSNIGKSIESDVYHDGFYQVVKPTVISQYGTISKREYLGNSNELKTLNRGDLIFGAEGTFRSFVCLDDREKIITNIHGVTIKSAKNDIQKSIFVKLMLDYFRECGICRACATGGNGGSLGIEYWRFLKFPNFPANKEKELTLLYHNPSSDYNPHACLLSDFDKYDNDFNKDAGINELHKSLVYLKDKLNAVISDIANDTEIKIEF